LTAASEAAVAQPLISDSHHRGYVRVLACSEREVAASAVVDNEVLFSVAPEAATVQTGIKPGPTEHFYGRRLDGHVRRPCRRSAPKRKHCHCTNQNPRHDYPL